MNKKYYKLTTELDGKQYSFFVSGTNAGIEYKINEWVKAPKWLAEKGYHLFVFNNLKNVKRFVEGFGFNKTTRLCYNKTTRLWLCEIEDKFDTLPYYISTWNLLVGSTMPNIDCTFPKGTVMAKKVKLIKQVEMN